MKIGYKNTRKIIGYIWLRLSNMPMNRTKRWYFIKKAGVKFLPPSNPQERHIYFIGTNVTWDSAHPELIEVGNNAHITNGCVILTHYFTLDHRGWVNWHHGKVSIGEHVFLGTNTIITKPVTIGHHSVVGAGSVVTKDIPPCEIWGGVPAKFIKKFEITE
ncbi:MAG: acyltransferase [Muribaculaceae bacterium]|uniref:acyltransferase n=1 Tax=Muribaculum intestinale TaxID=1796646 RepID=UPI001A1E4E18|nr:acyltransferase [Muribaculum intestinale]MBJ2183787.1 acyltransferase [Muribaculaceae bacterium]